MTHDITTPPGRIVWGHPLRPQQKKYQDGAQKGQPILKDGQPVMQWAFGLAIDKAEFQQHVWPAMAAEAAVGYPNGVPPRFAWKYTDGDGIDSKGIPFSNREGYAGCYVLTITTEAASPTVWKLQGGTYVQMTEQEIKTGDFFAAGISLKVNVATGTNTPSLYVNPLGLQFVGYGDEIRNGPDPMTLFGGQQFALPPGASATPMQGGGSTAAPGMPGGMPQNQQPPAPQQQPGQMPMQQPGNVPPPMQQPQYQQPQQPAPGQYQQPQQPAPGQYQQPQQPAPGQYQQPAQGGMPPPAHDFVQNAGQPGMPQQQPAQGGMPGMMPGNR